MCRLLFNSIVNRINYFSLATNLYMLFKCLFFIILTILSNFKCYEINYYLLIPIIIIFIKYINPERQYSEDLYIYLMFALFYYLNCINCVFIILLSTIYLISTFVICITNILHSGIRSGHNDNNNDNGNYLENDIEDINIHNNDVNQPQVVCHINESIDLRENIQNSITNNINLEDPYCIICLETEEDNYVTFKCNHTFHINCISEWISYSIFCPICKNRLEIENQQILME